MNPTPPTEGLPATQSITYSVTEAAAVLGISQASVYRLIYRRLLKPMPGLGHKRLSKDQIQAFARGVGKS